jgi:hypothetical protein
MKGVSISAVVHMLTILTMAFYGYDMFNHGDPLVITGVVLNLVSAVYTLLVSNWSIDDFGRLEVLISECMQIVYLIVVGILAAGSALVCAVGCIAYQLADNIVLFEAS